MLACAYILLNTMLLGASLSKGPTASGAAARRGGRRPHQARIPTRGRVKVGAPMARLALAAALLLVTLMERSHADRQQLDDDVRELAGGKAPVQLMSTLIFSEYLASPVLLTASLTAFMAFVQLTLPRRSLPGCTRSS